MEKNVMDYKRRTWKILATFFEIHKPWLQLLLIETKSTIQATP